MRTPEVWQSNACSTSTSLWRRFRSRMLLTEFGNLSERWDNPPLTGLGIGKKGIHQRAYNRRGAGCDSTANRIEERPNGHSLRDGLSEPAQLP